MRKIRVLSKKYDGSLRDEYETCLHAETDEYIILFSLPGLGYWNYREHTWLHAQDGLLEIYLKKKWYNVWHIAEQISHINLSYVNICLPAALKNDILVWVDLDLDYRLHMDLTVERLDELDFAENTRRMGYPPELLEQVEATCREVEAGLASKTFPFNYEHQVALYQQIKAELDASRLKSTGRFPPRVSG